MTSPDGGQLVPLVAQLQRAAALHPDRVLLHHAGRNWTYGELCARAQSLAQWLHASGVRAGDRVAVAVPNSADYVVAYFGAQMAGACAVTLDSALPGSDLAYSIDHSGAVAAVLSAPARQRLTQAAARAAALRSVIAVGDGTDGGIAGVTATPLSEALAAPSAALPSVSLDGLAQIIYTSGTTGRPKGVTLSHRNLAANTRSIVASLPLRENSSVFAILPFSYSYGNSLLLTHVSCGGRVIVAPDFVFWNDVLNLMQREGATGFAGIPSSFAMLMTRSDFLQREWPDLRYLTCAGGALPQPSVQKLRAQLPRVDLYLMYGQTEAAARLTCLGAADVERKAGSAGRPIAGVELAIRGETGEALPPGESGQIVARGDNVMVGYWGDADATGRVLRPGGLFTGDVGRLDADGYLFIAGRGDDVIKSGGYRIGPQEIEDVLLEIDGVAEAGVAGKPDEVLGAVPVAYVVARGEDPSLAGRIRDVLKRRLPRYKVPADIHFVKSLPRTANGKLQRRKLGL